MGSKTVEYAVSIVEPHESSKNIYKFNLDEFKKTIRRADIARKKKLMTIFNSDDLSEPKAILEATVDSINLSAEQKSRATYDQHMKEQFFPSLSDLSIFENIHKTAEKLALDLFEARPKLGEENTAKFNKENLTKYFEFRYDEYKRTVEQNIQMKERERWMEEQKKRIAAEQEAERQRIKTEEERIRRARDEQERNIREQKERLRKENERWLREYEELQVKIMRQQEEQRRIYSEYSRRVLEEQIRMMRENEIIGIQKEDEWKCESKKVDERLEVGRRRLREYKERLAQMRREQEEQERRNQENRRRIQAERKEMARQLREAEGRRKDQEWRELIAGLQHTSSRESGYSPSFSSSVGYFPSSSSGGRFHWWQKLKRRFTKN